VRRAALAAVALVAAGCSRKPAAPAGPVDAGPPPVRITRLAVADDTPPELRPAPVPADELRSLVQAALVEAGFTVGERDESLWRASVEARVVYGVSAGAGLMAAPGKGQVKARWIIEARLRPPGTRESLSTSVEAADAASFDGAATALGIAVRARVRAAMWRAAASLKARAGVLTRDVPGLIAALDDPDPEARHAAASRLGMLRSRAAVPKLIERLGVEKNREVRLRLIGAVAEIGDERAADALIALAQPRDREQLRAVVDALSVIGGARVNDFLDILGAHDSADVRELVHNARRRLQHEKRRAGE